MTSRLVAVVYDTRAAAEEALRVVEGLDLIDAAIVQRDVHGRIELQQTRDTSLGEGAVAGGTAGLLVGLLFALPVGAALAGLLVGLGWGARDTGIKNDELRTLGESLTTGQAVLCVLVEQYLLPDVNERLAPYGGETVDTEVSLP